MAIDTTFSDFLLPGERIVFNPVVQNQCDESKKQEYVDWLEAQGANERTVFLKQFISALRTMQPSDFPDPSPFPDAWVKLLGYEIAKRIADRGLQDYAELVMGHARPALRIGRIPKQDANLPIGASKFGGFPDVPSEFKWPIGGDCRATYNDDTEGEQRLAGFLCQINLEEVRPTAAARELPATGLLSFFGFQDLENDNPDLIGVCAKWFPDLSVLARCSPPGELTEGNQTFASAEVSFEEILDLPRAYGGPWGDDFAELIAADEEAFDFGSWDNIENMMGYAVATSGDNPTPNKQSRHLIYIDHEVSGWQWPALHLQIDERDLAEREFENLRLVWVDWD